MFGSIQFPFDFAKTAQASALFFDLYDRNLHWRYLTSLLYLADRKHLIQCGCPITGDTYVCVGAMPNLINTNELIHHRTVNDSIYPSQFWQKYFSSPDNKGTISLIRHPGNTELTASNELVIQELAKVHRGKSLEELEELISNLAECEDRGYTRLIRIYDILAKHGYVIEDLIQVKNDAERELYFSKVDKN